MEDIKQYKKTFSKLGLCYLIGTAAVYLLQIAVSVGLGAVKPEWLMDSSISLILSCVIVYGIGMPLIVFLAKGIPSEKPERHHMKWWQFVLAIMMCYALMIVSNLIGIAITTLIGVIKGSEVQNNLLQVVTEGNMFVNFIAMVIIAPIVEEWVFRKVLVDRTLRYGQGVAIVTSGVMFGLFHGNLNQFAYAVMLGGFFAFLYIKTGNLKITIGMHAIINFLGSMVAPLILKMINYNELLNIDTTDMEAVMEFVTDNLAGWIVYMMYALFIFGVVLAGIILFIVSLCCKRFKLAPGTVSIPKGKKFNVVMLNLGMILFCIVWVVLIVCQLLA